MFERFTEDARAVVVDALTHAKRLQHNFIGCEHILLALASRDDAVGETLRGGGVTAAKIEAILLGETGPGRDLFARLDQEALASVGIDVTAVREAVEAAFGQDALRMLHHYAHRPRSRRFPPWRRPRDGRRPFTPRAKDCLSGALKQATRAHDNFIGTEHIAHAALSMKHSAVPRILAALGASPDTLRADIDSKFRKAG